MPLLGVNGTLPLHKSSAVREKEEELLSNNAGWFQPPIPGVRKRRLRDLFPTVRLRRQRGPFLVCFACMAVVLTVILVSRGLGRTDWDQESSGEPPTLVFRREDLQRIWNWEIASGHFPSRQSSAYFVLVGRLRLLTVVPVPKQIGLVDPPINPALPPKSRTISPSRYRPSSSVVVSADTDTLGVGPKRIYLDIQSTPPLVSYPPRPVPGSVADLDVVMKHCDFSQGKVPCSV
jgi:WD repeat and SOF domain-containing protein 1